MKKILSIVLALTMVLALAVPAFAADEYTAFVMFTTSSWNPSAMSAADHNSVTITGDGTYTIETDQLAGATDALVFCVDIIGLHADHPDATAVLDSIEVDGEAVEFNADAIIYGDIEENGNLRIEIRNEYGATVDAAIAGYAFSIDSTLKVTFTVSGLDEADASTDVAEDDAAVEEPADNVEETETAPEATSPSTGISLAVVPAIIAMAAVVVSKKR